MRRVARHTPPPPEIEHDCANYQRQVEAHQREFVEACAWACLLIIGVAVLAFGPLIIHFAVNLIWG